MGRVLGIKRIMKRGELIEENMKGKKNYKSNARLLI